jgi:hexosaminidase
MEALPKFARFSCLARAIILSIVLSSAVAASAHPALIPMPASVAWRDGSFAMRPDTAVDGEGVATPTAAFLARELGVRTAARGASRIRLKLVSATKFPNPEGYRLHVAASGIRIEASDPRGLFYGAETLLQLVSGPSAPAVDISDAPRFRWRGFLVDVARHFYGKPTLFRIIDQMAAYKLNLLHLHLTDDPGWRIEIPGYPKLTQGEVGAGGSRAYFTADDIREIVAYAAQRHIIVVPEIEMPSHSGSAGIAYPQLYNGGSALDPASPATYAFIRAVFGEVARLFPEPYIHFGGDEVGDDAWNKVADVQQLKAREGLKDTKAVEAYFVRNVVMIIEATGKRPVAWDEQAEAGAAKDVVIQWWRKGRPDVLAEAAARGDDLIMSPVDYTYFDYHQAPGEPGAPWEGNDGGPISIARILMGAGARQLHAHAIGQGARRRSGFVDRVHRQRALSRVHDLPAPARVRRRRLASKGSARRGRVLGAPSAACRGAPGTRNQRPPR